MPRFRPFAAAVGAGLAAAVAIAVAPPATAVPVGPAGSSTPTARSGSAARSARITGRPIVAGAGWLATQFVDTTHLPHPDGNHFSDQYGKSYYPDYGLNADVIFGLAAAHAGRTKIWTALGYLRHHVHADTGIAAQHPRHRAYDGSVGKLALAVIVAGGRPRHFGGDNLIAVLRRDECSHASADPTSGPCPAPGAAANIYASESESFVLLALARAGVPVDSRAQAYFRSLQCASGGFTTFTTACGSGKADIDATSYALMALQALGGHPAMVRRAVQWLRGKQRAAGYWVTQGAANTDSTGLAAAALAGLHRPVRSARSWLRAQQVPAGSRGAGAFRYEGKLEATSTSGTSESVIATAQALTGLAPHGSLATVSAQGAQRIAPVFRPRATVPTRRVRSGTRASVIAIGFAAGERIRVRLLRGRLVGHGSAGPLGVARVRYRVPAPGRHTLVVHGVASRLAARHRIVARRTPSRAATSTGTGMATAHFTALTTAKPSHVAILIKGKGVRCVAYRRGTSGDAILNKVATVTYRSDGLILQIDGNPASKTADSTHYWSYWHDINGSWRYSNSGASSYHPAAGTVEGWAYDNGQQNPPKPNAHPAGLYRSICGSQDRATQAAQAPPSRPSSTPGSHHAPSSHPAARRHSIAPAASPSSSAAQQAVRANQPSAGSGAPAVARTHANRRATALRAHRTRRSRQAAGSASRPRAAARAAAASAPATSAPAPTRSPVRRLLVKPTAQSTTGSPLPTVLAVCLVAVLLAGGGIVALRRRRSE